MSLKSPKERIPKVSPFVFKWMMNLYPPFLFGRIRVKYVSDDFQHIQVIVRKSLFNKNLSRSVFGGTMFAAADPFYALMYWQNFAHQFKQKVKVWLKSAEIQYRKPAMTDLTLDFRITQADVEEAKQAIESKGKYTKIHEVELIDKEGKVSALVKLEPYVGLP